MFLEEDLQLYNQTEDYPFHMPGHKRRAWDGSFLNGNFPLASVDISEIPGFDDLHEPGGILKEEMAGAAAFYGTRATLFSVNGTTASNLAAISAAVPFGGRLLMAGNCHRSVAHAAELLHLETELICPEELAPDVPGPVTPEAVEAAFVRAERRAADQRDAERGGAAGAAPGLAERRAADQRDAERGDAAGDGARPVFDAVIITSPTYEGVISDTAAIAEIVHAHGSILIVDEAHGAHLSLHPALPNSAVWPEGRPVSFEAGEDIPDMISLPEPIRTSGAMSAPQSDRRRPDLVTQSLHKTLPSLTQTSLLHNVTGRVPTEALMKWLDIYETSSPSYILMASITSCLHRLMERGTALFDDYVNDLATCRKTLGGMKHLGLLAPPGKGGQACLYDPSKIVILTGGTPISGEELADRLRRDYHLVFEKSMPQYALAMTSVSDSKEGFERLVGALTEIDRSLN